MVLRNICDRPLLATGPEAREKLAQENPPKDRILGMFADDPESVDEMLAEVMKDRAAHPLNQKLAGVKALKKALLDRDILSEIIKRIN